MRSIDRYCGSPEIKEELKNKIKGMVQTVKPTSGQIYEEIVNKLSS
jgi:hypothetical protein